MKAVMDTPEAIVSASDEFDISVDEAVRILGISRSRLSQLTSRGRIRWQRRRVGQRYRLFYSRQELLNLHRIQMGGGASAGALPPQFVVSLPDQTLVATDENIRNDVMTVRGDRSLLSLGASGNRNSREDKPLAKDFAQRLDFVRRQRSMELALQKLQDQVRQLAHVVEESAGSQHRIRKDMKLSLERAQQEIVRFLQMAKVTARSPSGSADVARGFDSSEKSHSQKRKNVPRRGTAGFRVSRSI